VLALNQFLIADFSILGKIPTLWLQIAVVGTWLGMILAIAAGFSRLANSNPEIVRKIVHIGTGNVILFAWWFDIPAWVGIGASVLAGITTLLSYRLPILPGINSIGRKSLGTFFYAISIGILVAWFWTVQKPYFAALGILVMTWGDGLAALIGQRYGKHVYTVGGVKKSWEGSLTMAVVSYIVSSSILLAVEGNTWLIWVVAFAVALVATGLEAFSWYGIDNLSVPIASAGLAFLLTQLW
jgi:phytol kinase